MRRAGSVVAFAEIAAGNDDHSKITPNEMGGNFGKEGARQSSFLLRRRRMFTGNDLR
jgi:hypothetical protein